MNEFVSFRAQKALNGPRDVSQRKGILYSISEDLLVNAAVNGLFNPEGGIVYSTQLIIKPLSTERPAEQLDATAFIGILIP